MKEELKDLHLVVLMGGPGSEREVSLRSGAAVARAFDEGGYRVTPIEVRGTEVSLPSDAGLCINMIHGTFGEDGQLQALLEARAAATRAAPEFLREEHRAARLAHTTSVYSPASSTISLATGS